MKRLCILFWSALLFFMSCSENQSGEKITEAGSINNENKFELGNVETSTIDTFTFNNNFDLNGHRTYTKDFDLFWIRDLEENAKKKVGFISLSDIYQLSEHSDSLAIPNLENVDQNNLQYLKLNSIYRKRFLSGTNILETDSVFIYDYSTDVLLAFPVKELNVIAYLNVYMDIDDCPCSQFDYMIGFEVEKSNLNGLGKYFSDALVFIGKKNPFALGQMKAIVWKKIKTERFPLEKSNLAKTLTESRHENAIKGQAYLYETDNYQVFIQDYTDPNNLIQVQGRHLVVVDKQSDSLIDETIFSDSEGASVTPLNYGINNSNYSDLKEQWMGKLLKDKPDVIFGFESVSFGCPSIMYINSEDKYIQINCDNRH